MEGQVGTQKQYHRARGTHILETASGGTSQNTETILPREGHSHPGDGIRRDKSGHRNNPTEREALTYCRRHRGGQIRTQKQSHSVRGTHILETASGGISQDTETIPPSEGHSLPGDGIGRDKSGHRDNPTKRGALTLWRRYREGQFRTQKQSHRARGTHILETAVGGTGQDTETIPPREGHSLSEDSIRMDKSGHRNNPTERGALTSWRRHREG